MAFVWATVVLVTITAPILLLALRSAAVVAVFSPVTITAPILLLALRSAAVVEVFSPVSRFSR